VVVVSNRTRRVCTECTQDLTFTCFRTILDYVEETIETQNITLSLPQEILLKVKQLAVKRPTSVSGLLAQTLERLVHQMAVRRGKNPRGCEMIFRPSPLGFFSLDGIQMRGI